MKNALSLILALMLCLSLCACGFDQDLYDTHLSGKRFESDGRILTFKDDNCMTYTYTNLMGDTFSYTYSVTEISSDDNKITLTLKQVFANNDTENIDKDKIIEAIYNIADNNIKYYSNLYEFVD